MRLLDSGNGNRLLKQTISSTREVYQYCNRSAAPFTIDVGDALLVTLLGLSVRIVTNPERSDKFRT